MRAARHAEVGGQSMAGGPAQRRTGGPICQAGHAAPKLGRNIRLVTRNKVVGSLEPDGRLKFLSAANTHWVGKKSCFFIRGELRLIGLQLLFCTPRRTCSYRHDHSNH